MFSNRVLGFGLRVLLMFMMHAHGLRAGDTWAADAHDARSSSCLTSTPFKLMQMMRAPFALARAQGGCHQDPPGC